MAVAAGAACAQTPGLSAPARTPRGLRDPCRRLLKAVGLGDLSVPAALAAAPGAWSSLAAGGWFAARVGTTGTSVGLQDSCRALSRLQQPQGEKTLFKNVVNPLGPGSAVTGLLKHESRTLLHRHSAKLAALRGSLLRLHVGSHPAFCSGAAAHAGTCEGAKQSSPRLLPKPKSSPSARFWW